MRCPTIGTVSLIKTSASVGSSSTDASRSSSSNVLYKSVLNSGWLKITLLGFSFLNITVSWRKTLLSIFSKPRKPIAEILFVAGSLSSFTRLSQPSTWPKKIPFLATLLEVPRYHEV
jgi:hypothetical protein